MAYTIEDIRGVTNYESRQGLSAFVIVNHISAGTLDSMTNWFRNPASNVSSHYAVGRDGRIVRYVDIRNAAWTQGLSKAKLAKATAPVVRDMNCNPNLYCVSIEHEGYEGNGLDGSLTEEQFWATCWLHRYIMDEITNVFNVKMNLSNYNVIGHYQIDPQGKPNCPGPRFPWDRLREQLAIAEKISLEDYEATISGRDVSQLKFDAVHNQMAYLLDQLNQGNEQWVYNQVAQWYDRLQPLGLVRKI